MSNKSEVGGNVPKLRFPEFREAPEWKEKTVGSMCKTFSGGTPATSQKEFYGGNIPFIRSAEIDKDQTELFLTTKGIKNSAAKLVNKGDVLVALYGANSGDVALSKLNGAINQAILCLKSEASNGFIFHFLSLRKSWIISTYLQGGQGNLSGDIVKSIRLHFPQAKEQQKIADCFSSIDELIAAQTQKLDALKAHKKGLMQQLFPAEGETVPKLRFSEFRDDPEWKEKSFSEFITEMESGVSVNSYDTSVMDVSDAGILKTSCVAAGVFFPDENKKIVELEVNLAKTIPKKNTILVSRMNTPLLVGESGYVCKDYPNLFLPDRLWRISCNESTLNTVLFSKYLASDKMRSSLRFAATGTSASMKNVSKSTFLNFKLHIPSSVAEQQKIAGCLSSIDDLIAAQTHKIEALKAHKKGLMQQLFPSADEAHG